MVNANDGPDTNRPYGPIANATAVLERARSRNLPEVIDVEYLRDAGVPEGTLNRTLFGLHFLGLIDEAGEPSQELRAIHTSTDEEYRDILGTLVRRAYAEVFDQMNPAEDTQDRIVNFFRRYSPASQRSRMVAFFLGMCREVGIPTLDAPRQRQTGGRQQTSTPRAAVRTPARDGGGGGAGRQQQESGIPAALAMLVRSLPEPGTPMTQARRKQWSTMAEAALAFMYPEEGAAVEPAEEAELMSNDTEE